MTLTEHLEKLYTVDGMYHVVAEVLRLYNKTPANYRTNSMDCIESTYLAELAYEEEMYTPDKEFVEEVGKDHVDEPDAEFPVTLAPNITSRAAMAIAEENFQLAHCECGYYIDEELDNILTPAMEMGLGSLVKAIYTLSQNDNLLKPIITLDVVNFCKKHSKCYLVVFLYLAGKIVAHVEIPKVSLASTILINIGYAISAEYQASVTFNDPKEINTSDKSDKAIIEYGKQLYGIK